MFLLYGEFLFGPDDGGRLKMLRRTRSSAGCEERRLIRTSSRFNCETNAPITSRISQMKEASEAVLNLIPLLTFVKDEHRQQFRHLTLTIRF